MKEKEIQQKDCAHTYEKYLAQHLGNSKWKIYYKCPKCKKIKGEVKHENRNNKAFIPTI